MPDTILLPGMHGTAELFAPFVAAAPPGFSLRPLSLPNEQPLSYDELTDWVLSQLPPSPIALIAESFAGPLALMVADRCPRVTAVVICASFVEPPHSKAFARIPRVLLRVRPPRALIRFLWSGGDAVVAEAVHRAVARVSREVMADRVTAVLRVDVTAELERFTRPLMFLGAGEDRVVPSRCFRRARALKPSAHFASVPAPHLILQTHPTESWRSIGPFLEEVNGRGSA